jgi:hypothetical protein
VPGFTLRLLVSRQSTPHNAVVGQTNARSGVLRTRHDAARRMTNPAIFLQLNRAA